IFGIAKNRIETLPQSVPRNDTQIVILDREYSAVGEPIEYRIARQHRGRHAKRSPEPEINFAIIVPWASWFHNTARITRTHPGVAGFRGHELPARSAIVFFAGKPITKIIFGPAGIHQTPRT